MARRLSRRELTMVVLLGAAGVAALYLGGGPGGGGSGLPAPPELASLGEPPVIEMARLEIQPAAYDPQGRNLFQYYTPPPPARPKPVPQPPVQRPQPQVQPPPPPPPPREPVKAEPQPPPIRFAYLGFLGPKDARIAVFEENQEILLARPGEVVQDKFVVVDFKYEGVVMGYTDERFRDKTTELTRKRR